MSELKLKVIELQTSETYPYELRFYVITLQLVTLNTLKIRSLAQFILVYMMLTKI